MVAKLRTSFHSLNLETGRHGSKACSLHKKCCSHCTDQDALELLLALPGDTIPIIEDELHVLNTCPQVGQLFVVDTVLDSSCTTQTLRS